MLDIVEPMLDNSYLVSLDKYYISLSSDLDHQTAVIAQPIRGKKEVMAGVFVHSAGIRRADPTAAVQEYQPAAAGPDQVVCLVHKV